MRTILSWAAAAAILAVAASVWGQQPSSQGQAQASGQSSATPSTDTSTSSTTQSTAPQQESLADAARKAREAKKESAKPPRVFDNDNLPGGTISTVGKSAVPEVSDAGAADATADGKKSDANSEKAWRDKFAQLRAKLARDQEDLAVMQRELGVLNLQNYSDPTKGLQQELTRGDINKKTADIDAKQKGIQADQQAIEDAQDDLRKAGGDSGWAR
jgi:chromosome segregation ATPase